MLYETALGVSYMDHRTNGWVPVHITNGVLTDEVRKTKEPTTLFVIS